MPLLLSPFPTKKTLLAVPHIFIQMQILEQLIHNCILIGPNYYHQKNPLIITLYFNEKKPRSHIKNPKLEKINDNTTEYTKRIINIDIE